jgi:hypothetical protein
MASRVAQTKQPKPQTFTSVDEAVSALLPRPEPEVVEPAAIPAAQPWPQGAEIADTVLERLGEHLSRVARSAS